MIVFISNFISEHQIPFCEALFKNTNGEFCFIATKPMSEERKKLGFVDQSDRFPYVLASYTNKEAESKAYKLALKADVVILGDASCLYVDQRINNGKITFKYTERYFKQSRLKVLDPRVLRSVFKQDFQYRKLHYYLLCAGAYVAGDAALIRAYPEKMYKWGYFPKTIRFNNLNEFISSKEKNSLIWAGRFIDWKHPEVPVKIAKELKKRNTEFHMTMIGNGPLFDRIDKMVKKMDLSNYVTLTGVLPPEKVRIEMEKREIFIFTSDRNEGWGAVLNESMNAACVPIANRKIGSVPFLIKDGENGMIYDKANISKLSDDIVDLFKNHDKRKKMAKAAYDTIVTEWNAEVAAERFIELSDGLMHGKKPLIKSGVCSDAEIM